MVFYMPEYNLNAIGQMTVGQGYLTKTTDSVSLEICGDYADPDDNPIDLTAGWNMIGYLRLEPAAVDVVIKYNFYRQFSCFKGL